MARDDAVLLFVSSSGHGKRTPLAAFNRQGRGGQGVRGMRVTEARGEVVAAFTVDPGDEILVFSSAGNIVRMGVEEISAQGRDATGVRWPASTRAIPLSPWPGCSKPSRPTRTCDDGDARRRRRRSRRCRRAARRTDPWRVPRRCSRAFPPSRTARAREAEEATPSSASRRRGRCSSAATSRRSARSTSGRCSRSRSASTSAR